MQLVLVIPDWGVGVLAAALVVGLAFGIVSLRWVIEVWRLLCR